MHHKVIVIDDETVITGSFNFSASADKSNDENVVILRNPDIARRFADEFQRVYGAAKTVEQNKVAGR
jgi:phosphatidylserine/phosphatidylglycerophosphate/cardiolipin synthase-like enzyme